MAGVSQGQGPPPPAYPTGPPPPPPPPHGAPQSAPPGVGAGAEFFLSNYRLGKTLGIGSFGKVSRLRGGARGTGQEGRDQKEMRLAGRPPRLSLPGARRLPARACFLPCAVARAMPGEAPYRVLH